MNKNSKSARKQLAKAKQAIVITRPRTIQGSSLTMQSYVLNFGTCPRKSKRAKVGCPK